MHDVVMPGWSEMCFTLAIPCLRVCIYVNSVGALTKVCLNLDLWFAFSRHGRLRHDLSDYKIIFSVSQPQQIWGSHIAAPRSAPEHQLDLSGLEDVNELTSYLVWQEVVQDTVLVMFSWLSIFDMVSHVCSFLCVVGFILWKEITSSPLPSSPRVWSPT